MLVRTSKDKNNPYVMLHKGFLEDINLSLKAKGLLAYCMSKPDGWQFHVDQLVDSLKEGSEAIYSGLKELIEHGYCVRKQGKDVNSKFSKVDYVLYELPIQKILPQPGFPDAGVPDAGLPEAGPYISVKNESSNIDDDDDAHTRVGCGNVHNLAGNPPSSQSVEKVKHNGEKMQCTQSDYFRYCSKFQPDFKTDEILEAWERFARCEALIGDWKKYLDQIIINKRRNEKSCSLQTKNENTKPKDSKKRFVGAKSNHSGAGSQTQLYPERKREPVTREFLEKLANF